MASATSDMELPAGGGRPMLLLYRIRPPPTGGGIACRGPAPCRRRTWAVICYPGRRASNPEENPTVAQPLLAHNVYFTLNDPSDAAKARLVAACKKYLTGHPGTVFFACGTLAPELRRPVNVLDFD